MRKLRKWWKDRIYWQKNIINFLKPTLIKIGFTIIIFSIYLYKNLGKFEVCKAPPCGGEACIAVIYCGYSPYLMIKPLLIICFFVCLIGLIVQKMRKS